METVGTPWDDRIAPSGTTGGVTGPIPSEGRDVIYSLGGNDTVLGAGGDDWIDGGPKSDILYGGNGDDTIWGETGSPRGYSHSDWIYGEDGNDWLDGGRIWDKLWGGDGDDTLHGGDHGDTLDGEAGDDFLSGDGGADTLTGGDGRDTFAGTAEDLDGDLIKDFEFDDIIRIEGVRLSQDAVQWSGSRQELLIDTDGDDTPDVSVTVNGSLKNKIKVGPSDSSSTPYTDIGLTGQKPPPNKIIGTKKPDELKGDEDDELLDGRKGADTMVGGDGDDTYVCDNLGDVVTEDADSGADRVLSSVTYTLGPNIEDLMLTGGAIAGIGNTLDNAVIGNKRANDLFGEEGDDTLDGGRGNDVLEGGPGDDVLRGGKGPDAASYFFADGPVTVRLWIEDKQDTGADGHDLLSGIEDLLGSQFDDLLDGDNGPNIMLGFDGNDTLDGWMGRDSLAGGLGDDLYVVDNPRDRIFEFMDGGHDRVESYSGYKLPAHVEELILIGTGDDKAIGNALDNLLVGNADNNKIVGGKGDDTIMGGYSRDVLKGGAGADLFVLEDPTFSGVGKKERDVIKGFKAAQGDRIDLSLIDANDDPADGDQAFDFIGNVAFGDALGGPRPGLLRFENQLLQADLDGDGDADMECALPRVKNLDLDAFLL